MSLAYRLAEGESKLYSAMNPRRLRVVADISGPSKTRQEFADECDINQIMANAEKHAVWPFKDQLPPVYLDFVGMPNLQEAMQHMFDAEEAFMRLPAAVRKELDNDPVRFVEYASDPGNLEQLRKWGLAEPEKAPEAPIRVEVVQAPPIVPTAPAALGHEVDHHPTKPV